MISRLIQLSVDEVLFRIRSLGYQQRYGSQNPLQKVLVNGSPKTGTTWMLRLIATIPGYREVGNFNGKIQRYYTVQPGQVVHGHDGYGIELGQILESNQIKVILMLRDPRDQLISRVFHVRRAETHKWHNTLNKVSLDEAITLCIEGRDGLPGTQTMISLNQSWLQSGLELLCVRYEDLLANPRVEFQRAVDYLGIHLSPTMIDVIVDRNSFERLSVGKKFWHRGRKQGQADPKSHFRKGIVGDWKNYLNAEHIRIFKEVAGIKLIELGYERDLDW